MSVDDRLRSGLAANAGPLVPQGEARLAAVHARNRRRLVSLAVAGAAVAAATVVLALGVAGGVDRAAPPDPVPPAATVTAPPAAAELIPDSTWRRVITRAQARDEGVSEDRIRDDIGEDGRLPMELQIRDGSFLQTGDFGGSVWEIGDTGSVTYDDRRRLLVTSTQCGGCPSLTVVWRIEGRRLVVTRLDASARPMERAVWLGTWRRTD